ncbi:MAG: hypothetical protein SVV80_03330 [Planctomycetota bacterium]|nr:hypothetical protein [Planctomycetota bacterium]
MTATAKLFINTCGFLFYCLQTVVVTAVAAGLLPGCQPPPKPPTPEAVLLNQAIDPIRLKADLQAFADRAFSSVVATASDIAAGTKDRKVRENTLIWKIRTHSACQGYLLEEDPRMGFVSAWTGAVQLRKYLTEGEGKDIFGNKQQLATATAGKIEAAAEALGGRYFPPEAIKDARDDIERLADQHAESTPFVSEEIAVHKSQSEDLGRVLGIPLLPVTALEGVGGTPKAIDRFTDVAGEFESTVQYLPQRMRWETELLLLEMESLSVVDTALREFKEFTASIRAMNELADKLPGKIRTEFENSLSTIEQVQPKLQTTLTEASETAGRTKEVAEQLAVAAQAWQATANETRLLLADWKSLDLQTDDDKDLPNVRDYTELARQTNAVVTEIRALLTDLDKPLAETGRIRQASAGFEAIINKIFWRAVALVLLIFVSAIFYRRVTGRKSRTYPTAS